MPSMNSTSYDLVSINGLMCYVPIGLTSLSSLLILTSTCISELSDPRGNPNSMLNVHHLEQPLDNGFQVQYLGTH